MIIYIFLAFNEAEGSGEILHRIEESPGQEDLYTGPWFRLKFNGCQSGGESDGRVKPSCHFTNGFVFGPVIRKVFWILIMIGTERRGGLLYHLLSPMPTLR